MTTDPNPHLLERVSIESIVNMFMKIFDFGSAQVCMVHVNVPRHMLTQIRIPIIPTYACFKSRPKEPMQEPLAESIVTSSRCLALQTASLALQAFILRLYTSKTRSYKFNEKLHAMIYTPQNQGHNF